MQFDPLTAGVLLRRYQRFLADVRLDDGREITVHCPNTGAMTGCAAPGSRVWLAQSANAKRKYAYTWELVETATGLACIHSARANPLAAEAVVAGWIPELAGYAGLRREAPIGVDGSRVDLLLEGGTAPCFVEVKSVTLCGDDGLGLFPDAVSRRGTRHLRELIAVRAGGARAVLLFCVLHSGIQRVAPADLIDPDYGATLRAALAAGVEVLAYATAITPATIALTRRLPLQI